METEITDPKKIADEKLAKLYDGELEMWIDTALGAFKTHRLNTCLEMLKNAVDMLETHFNPDGWNGPAAP